MNSLLVPANLARINSLTKYPSIPTYHALGEKGRLTSALNVEFTGDIHITEKIDGTNVRLVCTPEGVLIGSREDLLWATGDLIHNPALGIVDTVREFAHALRTRAFDQPIVVLYGEVYGHGVGAAAKQYATTSGTRGFRLFEVCQIPEDVLRHALSRPLEQIAAWREHGGQTFLVTAALDALATEVGCERVPDGGIYSSATWPRELAATQAFLRSFATSKARLDAGASGRAEGIVVRTTDRQKIAKLRFEDYERTLGK